MSVNGLGDNKEAMTTEKETMSIPEAEQPPTAHEPSREVILAPRLGLRDLTVVPTLFPAHIANLITTLATSARLSLRLSAFFVEAILEASQLSTRLSLGYTRKLLITAISSARRVYLMSNAALEGDLLGILGFGEDKAVSLGSDTFLQVLDKYTNLGIYIIHHTFTLAELFAISGFYLTANAVQSAHFAAQESVAVFDSLFGSNESSRALSSIITLVRTELLEDERFKAKDKGKITSLTALTKALTAFACLQSATWKRTEAKLKLRILHDCTVVEDGVQRSSVTMPNNIPAITMDTPTTIEAPAPGPQSSIYHPTRSQQSTSTDVFRDTHCDMELLGKGETYEVTDEYRESTTITRTFTVQDLEAMGLSFDKHTRSRSVPLSDKNRESSEVSSARIVEEDNEWLDVFSDGQEDGEAIPSIPNGSTSMGSKAFQEAMEHPTANTERIQFVLKTMTSKLFSRKRTVRTLPPDEGSTAVPSTSRSHTRPPVALIAWLPTDGMRSKTSVAKSSSDSSLDDMVSLRPSESVSGSIVTTGSSGESSDTTIKKAMAKAKSAFRPLTARKRVDRPASLPRVESSSVPSRSNKTAKITKEQKSPTALMPPTPPNTVSHSPDRSKRSRSSMTTVHESVQTASNRMQSATSKVVPERGTEGSEDQLFPHDSLVPNLHRFMRFSSAAYGQNFLRIFGMGDSDYNFPTTGQHHANSWSFAQHTKIPIASLLLSSYTEATPLSNQKAPPLIHYVAVDHERKAVILTCRGTLGLSDVLIDLTCDYCPADIEGADPDGEYYAHSGMYQSAMALTTRNSKVHQVLVLALETNATYGLVVTGHSLGGGVAALLAIVCSTPASTFLASKPDSAVHPEITTPFVTSAKSGLPPGRPIHCYAYGPPAVTSLDLANWAKGLIVSVVHGSDVVPTLSLGILRDLKNVALTLFEEGMVAEEIVGRVIGVYQRKFKFQQDASMSVDPSTDDQALADWTMSLIKTMRADMDSDKLYPPGNVYLMEYFDVCQTIHENAPIGTGSKSVSERKARRVILRHCESVQERFREPLFTKTMLNDHLPLHYERSTQLLVDGVTRGGQQ